MSRWRTRAAGWWLSLQAGATAWAAATGSASDPVPLPPLPPSPVAVFRQLLATNDDGRTRWLADRPAPQQRALEAKLQEYAQLTAEERERRLVATELRWYLRPLLDLPVAERGARLSLIPESLQGLIAERLSRWDGLTEVERREFLEYEQVIGLHQDGADAARLPPWRPPFPGERPVTAQVQALEDRLARWNALAAGQRDEMCQRFEEFFQLSAGQQARTLAGLSDEERRSMELTLAAFRQLPPSQRRLCLESFRRFADLTPEQRADFLRSADRWREMSAAEREHWRRLVTQLPPLPPGFGESLPPPPPGPGAAAPGHLLVTNSGP